MKCPKCGKEIHDAALVCRYCGARVDESDRPIATPFSASYQSGGTNKYTASTPAMQCAAYKNYSKVFLVVAIIIFIVGFIVGIVAGNMNQIIMKAAEISSYDNSIIEPAEKAFNTALMMYVWIGTALLGMGFLGVSFHLKNQKAIIDSLDKIIEQNREE